MGEVTPQQLIEAYDASMSGQGASDVQRERAMMVATAAAYAAQAYEMRICDGQGAHALARSFLLALIDPTHPELDYLRGDPAAGKVARDANAKLAALAKVNEKEG